MNDYHHGIMELQAAKLELLFAEARRQIQEEFPTAGMALVLAGGDGGMPRRLRHETVEYWRKGWPERKRFIMADQGSQFNIAGLYYKEIKGESK